MYGNMNQSMSEADLRRLAEILQERGEGLAAINQGEAQLLQALGGSGQALPGTQGMGPSGGPIRSYQQEDGRIDADHRLAILTDAEVEALNYLKHQDKENGFQSGNGPFIKALASMNKDDLDYYNYKGMKIPSLNDMSSGSLDDPYSGSSNGGNGGNGGNNNDNDNDNDIDLTNVGDLDEYYENESVKMQADNHNENTIKFETDPRVIQAYNNKNQGGGGDGGQQQGGGGTTTTKFKDKLGGEHNSQAEADAANEKISKQQIDLRSFINNQMTSDLKFENFSTNFFQEREKVTPGPMQQVKGAPRQETFDEWKTRTKQKSYEDYSTDPQITSTRPETYDEFMERIGFPVFNLNSYNESKKAYEDALKGEGNYTVEQVFNDAPLSESEYNEFLQKEYNTLKANNTLQMVDTFTTKAGPSTTSIVKESEGFELLPEAEVERIFNEVKGQAVEEARTQIPLFVEALNKTIRDNPDASAQEILNLIGTEGYNRLSDGTKLTMYEQARYAFDREEAFTLTPGEVAEFARDAVGISDEDTPDDVLAPVISDIDDADQVDVGTVDTPDEVTVDEITAINITDIDAVDDFDTLAEKLLDRIEGKTESTAEQQLARTTEQNLKSLLSLEAGNDIDPAKLRQIRNIYSEQQQVAIGQAAILRSEETQQAEQALVQVLQAKGTIQAQVELANLETRRLKAFKDADLELARQLSIQSTNLARVIAKADSDTNIEIANLNARKQKAIEQGKIDLAGALANLEKDTIIARTNATLALQSRALDDALALANYSGEQALYGIITKVDLAELQAGLTEMGFEIQRDLAELDAETQRYVAELTRQWRASQGNDARQGAILELVGTMITAYATIQSDYKMKREIRAADSQVEGFLDALNAYQYEYKDPHAPGADAGLFVGVMAQDLEKTPMGASFVKDTPHGKQVDYGHGLAAILASQSNIHDRLRRLEEG